MLDLFLCPLLDSSHSFTFDVTALLLFLFDFRTQQHPSLPPFAPQRSLSLSHPTSRVNSGHSNASGGGGGSRHASLVGLRSLSNSSGNGNLSVRSASLRPSRANSLSWSSTRASVSTSSPMAAASSSAASACSTAEVPPAEFLLRVLRLVATPPNAALSFAFLPSAAATAAAAAEAAMGSRHHHGDSSSLSVATPSTTQSSSVNASVSAAAAAPAIEGAAPTLHVNDILSGAPNLQVFDHCYRIIQRIIAHLH